MKITNKQIKKPPKIIFKILIMNNLKNYMKKEICHYNDLWTN